MGKPMIDAFEEVSLTIAPPAGAGLWRVTVPEGLLPPTTELGLMLTLAKAPVVSCNVVLTLTLL